ncbi:MAG: class I SAM-dependent methyltransferase [Chthoniobacterales bacterium]
MSSALPTTGFQQDEESVRQFFDQWHIYRKVVELNYLHHREEFAAVAEVLKTLTTPFSFIDLGAGDAHWTSRVLGDCPVKSYEAVDISAIALGYAKENLASFTCEKKFTQANFFEYVKQCTATYDVAFIGLSFHHLVREDKNRFFPEMRRIIKDGGRFLFYEPICEEGEIREEHFQRWWNDTFSHWDKMTPEELKAVHDHVSSSDYPEPPEVYTAMAKANGFREARMIYKTSDNYYGVFDCVA